MLVFLTGPIVVESVVVVVVFVVAASPAFRPQMLELTNDPNCVLEPDAEKSKRKRNISQVFSKD